MQISASTLLTSQQASPIQAKPAAGFTQALEKASGFQPLPLKEATPSEIAPSNIPSPAPNKAQKLGATIDLKV